MNQSVLFINDMITIFEWFIPLELIHWQNLSTKFFSQIIPMVMWRLRTFPNISITFIHYFEPQTKDVFLYDVINKTQTQFQIEREIPAGCRTIAVGKQSILLIGGQIKRLPQKLTWSIRCRTLVCKKDMDQERSTFGIAYDSVRKDVYVFGGEGQGFSFLNHCEKYSLPSDLWTPIAPMEKEKSNASACILDSKYIFVIGRFNYGCLNDIEKYNITSDSWESINVSA